MERVSKIFNLLPEPLLSWVKLQSSNAIFDMLSLIFDLSPDYQLLIDNILISATLPSAGFILCYLRFTGHNILSPVPLMLIIRTGTNYIVHLSKLTIDGILVRLNKSSIKVSSNLKEYNLFSIQLS